MKNNTGNNHIAAVSAVIAAVLSGISFYTDRFMFIFPDKGDSRYAMALTDYCICKVLAFAVLFAAAYAVIMLIRSKDEGREGIAGVVKCALPYLPVVMAVIAIKLPAGFVTNDEYAICESASNLVHDTWFNYMTVYYYIVSFMILPFKYSPVLLKAVIQLITAGYCVYRSKEYFGKKSGAFMYILFILYPVVAYTVSAHRLPIYFLLYLLLFTKMTFDLLEKKDISGRNLFAVLVAGAILTQWRSEGIYMLVLLPILLFIAYPRFRTKKAGVCLIVAYLLIQYVISIPQNGAFPIGIGGAANDRMKPFYAYTITNMFRNGLDTDKNAEDLAKIDEYIALSSFEDINEYYGDINYEDVFILYKEEFGGVREDADYTQYWEFSESCKRIFKNNIDVFLRTRWGAFCYAAMPYHITYTGSGPRELVSFAVSVVKTVTYCLFIPVAFAVFLLIYSLIKRRWFAFFTFGGVAAHWFLVFVLAPASYFKYYFPVYIMAYFFMIFMLIRRFGAKDKGDNSLV